MGKIISMINFKGGVGKTFLTINIAKTLVQRFNKRVLIIDLDPQMNATIELMKSEEWEYIDANGETLFHLFNSAINGNNSVDINSLIKKNVRDIDGLDLIPSSIRMVNIEGQLNSYGMNWYTNYFNILNSHLENIKIRERYDYVLIDCPPTLGMVTLNGIYMSDAYIVPIIPDIFSITSAKMLIKEMEEVKRCTGNWNIQLGGIILNQMDYRRKHNEIFKEIEWSKLEEYIIKPYVPRRIKYSIGNNFEDYMIEEKNNVEEEVFYNLVTNIMRKSLEW